MKQLTVFCFIVKTKFVHTIRINFDNLIMKGVKKISHQFVFARFATNKKVDGFASLVFGERKSNCATKVEFAFSQGAKIEGISSIVCEQRAIASQREKKKEKETKGKRGNSVVIKKRFLIIR
jgi:hypothetical protein